MEDHARPCVAVSEAMSPIDDSAKRFRIPASRQPARPPLILSIPEYTYLRDALCGRTGCEAGHVEVREFPDGERYQRLISDVSGRDVVLLAGTISDSATLAFYDLACTVVKYGAQRLTMIVPYFGYSTMERAVLAGEVVTAKCRARLLSAVPKPAMGSRILLLDLHSEGITHYFEGDLTALHLVTKPVICEFARRVGGNDFVLGSTDAGRAKWVVALANMLGVEAGFVYKRRLSGSSTEVMAINADVQGRKVVIYDDMIRTGGSLLGAAKAYRDAGATEISAIATHGLFPGDALKRLQDSGLFSHIACTDSHPRACALAGQGLELISIVDIFAEAVGRGMSVRDQNF